MLLRGEKWSPSLLEISTEGGYCQNTNETWGVYNNNYPNRLYDFVKVMANWIQMAMNETKSSLFTCSGITSTVLFPLMQLFLGKESSCLG